MILLPVSPVCQIERFTALAFRSIDCETRDMYTHGKSLYKTAYLKAPDVCMPCVFFSSSIWQEVAFSPEAPVNIAKSLWQSA